MKTCGVGSGGVINSWAEAEAGTGSNFRLCLKRNICHPETPILVHAQGARTSFALWQQTEAMLPLATQTGRLLLREMLWGSVGNRYVAIARQLDGYKGPKYPHHIVHVWFPSLGTAVMMLSRYLLFGT